MREQPACRCSEEEYFKPSWHEVHSFDVRQPQVHVDGAVNRPDVRSKRWTVETAIPVRQIGGAPPRVGGFWRINFSRVQWRVRVDGDRYLKQPGPEDNWVYGPMGLVNMHLPERWPILQSAEHGLRTLFRVTFHHRSSASFHHRSSARIVFLSFAGFGPKASASGSVSRCGAMR